jgi:hypothetical protein
MKNIFFKPSVQVNFKLLFFTMLLLVAGMATTACSTPDNNNDYTLSEKAYTIQLTSEGPQKFTGTIIVTRADGQLEVNNIESVAPTSYSVKGIQVDCTFQKTTATGYLKAVIMTNGKKIAEAETITSYGTIQLNGR